MRFFLLIYIFLIAPNTQATSQAELHSGLFFSSHEVVQDNRTSLNLTPEKPFKLSDGFTLDFDVNFRSGDGYYGYVFRIIGHKKVNLDFVTNFANDEATFSVIFRDQMITSFNRNEVPNFKYDQWQNIKLEVDFQNSLLRFDFNGLLREVRVEGIDLLNDLEVIFGAVHNTMFFSTDVSTMSIRNVKLFNKNRSIYRYWKLLEHSNLNVLDETQKAIATVKNPKWLIDQHIYWRKRMDISVNDLMGYAIDSLNGRYFLVDQNKIYTVNLKDMTIDSVRYREGTPYKIGTSMQVIYNPYTDELWSYNFDNPNISRFNFETLKWSKNPGVVEDLGYSHHSQLISPTDSSLLTLFGYGYYKYHSETIEYDKEMKAWVKMDYSDIVEPRYLNAIGRLSTNNLIVFGGYGSKTGKQEVSPRNFYDVYLYAIDKKNFKKLIEYPVPEFPYVPGKSLVFEHSSNSFYTLVFDNSKFKTNIQLAKYSLEKPIRLLYNDSIPFDYLDTKSWTDLFLNQDKDLLIAMTAHNSDISFYSIAYPPLNKDDVFQDNTEESFLPHKVLLIAIVAGLLFWGINIYRIKRRTQGKNKSLDAVWHVDLKLRPAYKRKEISSVLLLGGFQVFDRNGNDITSNFSPMLKQLFLLVFLSTIKDGKGISSIKLDDILWFDKEGQSARNNRNVNISKLRTILEDIDGLELISENSFWKIKINDASYCDYTDILYLIKKSNAQELEKEEITKLIGLLSFGDLLPNLLVSWVDEFKSTFSIDVIDCLSELIYSDNIKSDSNLCLWLTDCILLFDPVNEEAIQIKCRLLIQSGKKGIAKKVYLGFCRNYKQFLNEDYLIPFSDFPAK